MSRVGPFPFPLPPSQPDLMVARAAKRVATRRNQKVLRTVTLLADEKAVLAAAAGLWLVSRCSQHVDRHEADRLLGSVLIAGAVPHLFKLVVNRRRPDRSMKNRRRGIRHSGNAWDSFPSGHAVHLGAVALSAARLRPRWLRPAVWSALLSLAGTRVLTLAHYPSDVLAGFGMGLAISKAVDAALALCRRRTDDGSR